MSAVGTTWTVDADVALEVQDCAVCAVTFAAPKRLLDNRRKTGDSFYCPNGHSLSFTKTTEQKLREQLAEAERQRDAARANATAARDQRDAAERSNRALRGVVTRTKRRVQAGQCIACHESFPDLAAHMAEQHPGHDESDPHTEPVGASS